jgi:preprotein translocase subunit SecG
MFTVLLVVQILISISIITLVLLQQGKGADMGAGFGAGASGTVFGSRGSGSFVTRATAILATAFFINCLLIASPLVLHVSRTAPGSVVEQIQQQEAQQKSAEQEKTGAALDKLKGKATEDLPEVAPAPAAESAPAEQPAAEPAAAAPPAAATPAPETAGTRVPEGAVAPDKKPGDMPE